MTERSRYTIQAVRRVLQVLECFSFQRPELTLSQLSALLEERKGTVYRFVSTLTDLGYLEYEPETRRYSLGRKLLVLGQVALDSSDILRKALPYLRRLSEQTNENVNLGVLDGNQVLYLGHVESHQMLVVRLRVGTRLPIHCSSVGKILAAYLPEEERSRLMDYGNLERFTDKTITDAAELHAELNRIRQQGYAIADEELAEGLLTIAAPVRRWDGRVVAGVNVACLRHRVKRDGLIREIMPRLLAITAEISAALGAPEGIRPPVPGTGTN